MPDNDDHGVLALIVTPDNQLMFRIAIMSSVAVLNKAKDISPDRAFTTFLASYQGRTFKVKSHEKQDVADARNKAIAHLKVMIAEHELRSCPVQSVIETLVNLRHVTTHEPEHLQLIDRWRARKSQSAARGSASAQPVQA